MSEKIAALYVRVSTDIQKEKGESIEFQKARLVEYATQQGLKHQIYEDAGFSAKDSNRPALQRLIQDVENNKIQDVMVIKIDRISRSMRGLQDLLILFEKHQVGFKSLTQPIETASAFGRLTLKMLSLIAEVEREMTADRVGEHMTQRAKEGRFNGGVNPYGYTSYAWEVRRLVREGMPKEQAEIRALERTPQKKTLFVNKAEAQVVRKIYNQYIKFESLRAVTHWLNDNGYKTPNGTTWATTSVKRILTNPTYYGSTWYGKRITSKLTGKLKTNNPENWLVVPGRHEAIIEKTLFDQVHEILKRQSVEPRRKMSDYLLQSLVRCGNCGATFNGYSMTKTNSYGLKTYSYYKCHNWSSKGDSVCKGRAIQKDYIENAVIDAVFALADDKKFKTNMQKALNEFNKQYNANTKPLMTEKEVLLHKVESFQKKKGNLVNLLSEGTIDKQTYKTAIFGTENDLYIAQEKLSKIEVELNDTAVQSISFNAVYEIINNFKAYWKEFDYLSKKDLLRSLVSKIIVHESEIKIELFFIPELFSEFGTARMSVRPLHRSEKGMQLHLRADQKLHVQDFGPFAGPY